jgi:putative ABC transport system permease protein
VACLALGIGVNTAAFSITNAFLYRPMPFHDGDRVLSLFAYDAREDARAGMSRADLADVRAQVPSLADVAGMSNATLELAGAGGEPERISGEAVTHNLFSLLGVRPALGRGVLPW